MSGVQLRYRGPLTALTGCEGESVPAATVKDLLRHIKARYGPAAFKAARAALITVDGESITLLRGYATPLAPGQTVSFLPICAGG